MGESRAGEAARDIYIVFRVRGEFESTASRKGLNALSEPFPKPETL